MLEIAIAIGVLFVLFVALLGLSLGVMAGRADREMERERAERQIAEELGEVFEWPERRSRVRHGGLGQ